MRTVFVNVDTVFDFMRNDSEHSGTLYVPGAEAIEPNLERLTRYAAQEGSSVLNLADSHTLESAEISATPDYAATWPAHCLRGTKGGQFVPAAAPKQPYVVDYQQPSFNLEDARQAREFVLLKDHYDVFKGNPHAEGVLQLVNPQRAVVYGVVTEVCVDYAVMGLHRWGVENRRDIEIVVARDAIKEFFAQKGAEAIARWERTPGVRLATVDEIVRYSR
jgi:nicotinamidase/pyrazinamidase